MKIVLALALSDMDIRDADITSVRWARIRQHLLMVSGSRYSRQCTWRIILLSQILF